MSAPASSPYYAPPPLLPNNWPMSVARQLPAECRSWFIPRQQAPLPDKWSKPAACQLPAECRGRSSFPANDNWQYSNWVSLGDTRKYSRESPGLLFALVSSIQRSKTVLELTLDCLCHGPAQCTHAPYEYMTVKSRLPSGRHLEIMIAALLYPTFC